MLNVVNHCVRRVLVLEFVSYYLDKWWKENLNVLYFVNCLL